MRLVTVGHVWAGAKNIFDGKWSGFDVHSFHGSSNHACTPSFSAIHQLSKNLMALISKRIVHALSSFITNRVGRPLPARPPLHPLCLWHHVTSASEYRPINSDNRSVLDWCEAWRCGGVVHILTLLSFNPFCASSDKNTPIWSSPPSLTTRGSWARRLKLQARSETSSRCTHPT